MSGKTLGEIMSEKTLEGINKETPDMPGYYSDAIEYLNQFRQTLPDKFGKVLPLQTTNDIFESDFIVLVVMNTMSIPDCKKLISYAKRFQVFNTLLEYFIKEKKLPKDNATVKLITMHIIEAILAIDNNLLVQALKSNSDESFNYLTKIINQEDKHAN